MGLSVRRAKSVDDYLVLQGLAESRVSYRGVGEAQPIADNETAAGRALNRRVELVWSEERCN
jgi:OOP family OmpA-OmpF porin